MKNYILSLLLLLVSSFGYSQACSVNKCIDQPAIAQIVTPQPGYTYNWSIVPALGFVGQGTPVINIASVGSVLQSYVVTCVVATAFGCDTLVNCTINVINATAQLNLPSVCRDNGLVDLTQYANPAGGTFSGNGVVGTTFNPAAGTTNITYTVTGGNGCSATTNGVITVEPSPQPGNIQID
jgi:hypothetical protein